MTVPAHHNIPAGRHWADWRSAGRGGDADKIAMSSEVREFLRGAGAAAAGFTEGTAPLSFPAEGLSEADRQAMAEYLGQGECSVTLAGLPSIAIRETLFTGIWLVRGERGSMTIDIGPLPSCVYGFLQKFKSGAARVPAMPDASAIDSMAAATINEIITALEAFYEKGQEQDISFSHIPYPQQAQKEITDWLGNGGITFETTGTFSCAILPGRYYPAWYYRFYDRKGSIRNAGIEIAALPEVIVAPAEDIVESGRRILSSLDDPGGNP